MNRNFQKHKSNVQFIKTLINRQFQRLDGRTLSPVILGSSGSSYSTAANATNNAETSFSKIVIEVFGGSTGIDNYAELAQRSGIIPKGGLFAEDDSTDDRVNLRYEQIHDANFWMN